VLIVCNAMIKSASTLLFHYTQELVFTVCPGRGQGALMHLLEHGEITGAGGYVYPLDARALGILLDAAEHEGPMVVKAHEPLTPSLEEPARRGDITVVFSHRDPRDMILSAMDHRVRAEAHGYRVLGKFTSLPESVSAAKWWCEMACEWVQSGLACVFRYVDMVAQPERQLRRLREHLGLDVDNAVIATLVRREREARRPRANQFSQGKLSRYREELSAEEIELCIRELGRYIVSLGYSLEDQTGVAGGAR